MGHTGDTRSCPRAGDDARAPARLAGALRGRTPGLQRQARCPSCSDLRGSQRRAGTEKPDEFRCNYTELVANSGVQFTESREVELKGLDGVHRLFAVDLTDR